MGIVSQLLGVGVLRIPIGTVEMAVHFLVLHATSPKPPLYPIHALLVAPSLALLVPSRSPQISPTAALLEVRWWEHAVCFLMGNA